MDATRSCEVRHDLPSGLVRVTLRGRVTGEDLRAVTAAGVALVRGTGCLDVLIDTEGFEFVGTFVDLYELPGRQYEEANLDRGVRIALVLPRTPRELEAARFYEDASCNRGWKVRTFEDAVAAREWLRPGAAASGRG